MTPLAVSISDATIWSVTFDDTRSVDYDRNSFIIQATGVILVSKARVHPSNVLFRYKGIISGLYYKTITIVIDAPSVVKSDAPNCSVTY